MADYEPDGVSTLRLAPGQAALAEAAKDRVAELRSLSVAQRGALILSACQTAAMIEGGRRASGLRPVQPAPRPAALLAFLAEAAWKARS